MHRHAQRIRGRRQWNDDDASLNSLWNRHIQRAWLTVKSNNIHDMTSTQKTAVQEVVDEMRQRVNADSSSQHQHEGWNKAWEERLTPWDLGGPTPALVSELAKDLDRNPHWWNDRTLLRTLVPGCGAGYDLKTLAKHHDQVVSKSNNNNSNRIRESIVVGLDIAPLSLERAKSVLIKDDAKAKEIGGEQDDSNTQTQLVMGNFFDRNSWETVSTMPTFDRHGNFHSPTNNDSSFFDLVFDYTFFCALPPTLRPAWGEQISTLVHAHHGRLLTFIFPILPGATEMIGPPYPVSVADYETVLHPWGFELEYDGPFESPDTVPSRKGKEMVAWWTRRV